MEYRKTNGAETFIPADLQTNLDALFNTHASLAQAKPIPIKVGSARI